MSLNLPYSARSVQNTCTQVRSSMVRPASSMMAWMRSRTVRISFSRSASKFPVLSTVPIWLAT